MVYCYTSTARAVLRRIRLKRGLTQEEVAEYLNVTKGYISQIEAGQTLIPRYKTLIKILELYKIKPKYFEELVSKES